MIDAGWIYDKEGNDKDRDPNIWKTRIISLGYPNDVMFDE